MEYRIFTLAEANELLPQLKIELEALQALTGQFDEQYSELGRLKEDYRLSARSQAEGGGDPFFELEARLEFSRMEIKLSLDNFERRGVLLKMINPGLIDFPAQLDGEYVLICWKEGEERVTHYHGWNDGFVGRKPHPHA